MKKIYFLLSLSFLTNLTFGQWFCETNDTTPPLINFTETETDDTLIFRVYIHSIKTTSGEMGHTDEQINTAKCILIDRFAPHNIFLISNL
jgi:hypothetical protein